LESPKITNVIILQTVLDESKNQNISLYQRLRKIIDNEKKHFYVFSNEYHKETYVERKEDESINDRNDRAIRVAASWYMRTLSETKKVFLVTNDQENLKKALKEEISSKTVYDFVKETSQSDLLDLLNYSVKVDDVNTTELAENGKMSKKNQLFEIVNLI
jgi:exosome complex exonuclease DIS3/RRP44